MKIVLWLINATILFGVCLFAAIFLSTGDEWWSMYTFNMDEISPYNLEISWVNVFIFCFLSLALSFLLVKITSINKQ